MDDNTLKVQIDSGSRNTSAEAYLHILQATLDALKEINRSSSRFGTENVEWQIVDAGKNSPVFASIGWDALPSSHNGAHGDQDIEAFVAGLAHLERVDTCPPYFNLRSLKAVAKLINSFGHGVKGIAYDTSSGATARISHELARNANHAAQVLENREAHLGKCYEEYGSIEGHLLSVAEQPGKNRDKVTIVDELTGDEINCYFHDPQVELQARTLWKCRVVVTGEITVSRETGKPSYVRVAEIEALGGRESLPQMEDLRGIEITHGLDSAKYISDLRNAE